MNALHVPRKHGGVFGDHLARMIAVLAPGTQIDDLGFVGDLPQKMQVRLDVQAQIV